MAGDWIKMRTDLYRDPKVSVIADHLMNEDGELAAFVDQNMQRRMTVTRNVMRNVTVGALVSVWGVMRQRGKRHEDDMVCEGVTLAVLDDIADLPGFGDAMAMVGWVVQTDSGIEFPRFFGDYNVDPEEKAREKGAERQRRFRERQKAADAVTSNVTSNVTVTHREEKRREEKNTPKPSLVLVGFAKFWDIWPSSHRKGSKGECAKLWEKTGCESSIEDITNHVLAMAASEGWRKQGGEFIPAPLVYIRQRRWEGATEASGSLSSAFEGAI